MILLCSNRCNDTWTEFYPIFMTRDCLIGFVACLEIKPIK